MKRTPLKRVTPLRKVANFGIQIASGRGGSGSEVSQVQKSASIALRPRKRRKLLVRLGGVLENPRFRAFVRTFPCILRGLQAFEFRSDAAPGTKRILSSVEVRHVCSGRIEAAHTGVGSGMGQQTGDENCLPMCVSAHRTGKFSHHALGKEFWMFWGINREAEVEKMNAAARAEGIPLEVKAK